MNTYKITNITNLAGKRDRKFNTIVNIEYIDGRTKKTIVLKAGDNVFLTINSLPLSVHRLRIKNLITIEEVNLAELTKPVTPKPIRRPKPVKKPVEVVDKVEKKTTSKKKTLT